MQERRTSILALIQLMAKKVPGNTFLSGDYHTENLPPQRMAVRKLRNPNALHPQAISQRKVNDCLCYRHQSWSMHTIEVALTYCDRHA